MNEHVFNSRLRLYVSTGIRRKAVTDKFGKEVLPEAVLFAHRGCKCGGRGYTGQNVETQEYYACKKCAVYVQSPIADLIQWIRL